FLRRNYILSRTRDNLAFDSDTTLTGDFKPREKAQDRGFSATRWSKQNEAFRPLNLKRQFLNDGALSEGLRHSIEFDAAHPASPWDGITTARIVRGISDAIAIIKQREEIIGGAPFAIRVRMRAGNGSLPGGAVIRAMGTSRRHKMYAAS